MRIAMFASSYPPHPGGLEVAVRALATEFSKEHQASYAASPEGVHPIGQPWAYAGRVVLFLAPVAFLLMARGFAWVRWAVVRGGLLGLLVAVTVVPALAGLPYSRGEVRPALEYVAEHARPEDTLYLYYGLRMPLAYYRPATDWHLVQSVCTQSVEGPHRRSRATSRVQPRMGSAGLQFLRGARVSQPRREAGPELPVQWYPAFAGAQCAGVFR